jgi:tetratricopeptide (TPR) repeat protein
LYYSTKVLEQENDDIPNIRKAQAKLYSAQAEHLLGEFESSLTDLYDALDCLPAPDVKLRASIYEQMGVTYGRLEDYTRAIEMNEKATAIFKSISDSISLARCYNNRGVIHAYLDEHANAEMFFKQALAINRAHHNLKAVAANLNNMCLYEGRFEEKIQYLNEAIQINRKQNSQWSLAENYNNLGRQYFYAKQYRNALGALQKAYEVAVQIGAKELLCDYYEYSSSVYEALNNYKKAYECLLQQQQLTRQLQSGNKLRLVEQKMMQDRTQKQQRIAEVKEKNFQIQLLKRTQIGLSASCLLLIVAAIFVYKWYRRRKNMQLIETQYQLAQSQNELAELKVRQQDLELSAVHGELEHSKQEVTSFAMFLQSRNQLLDKIRELIKQGYKLEGGPLIAHLKKINAFIAQYQSGDKASHMLLMNVEDKSKDFLTRLDKLHPGLTSGERYLATLLRVNLSTKEIAMLTGHTPKTINMNRYRLRKSLGLEADVVLADYLSKI